MRFGFVCFFFFGGGLSLKWFSVKVLRCFKWF